MPDVIFSGPEGRLEGKYHHSKNPNAPVALVLHPHPKFGGTMNNRVTYYTYQSFVKQGFSVLRFNFRGVGRSTGKFDDGVGELADATSALDWLQHTNADAKKFWVAGFSFGSWIALQLLMRRPEIKKFIAIAPPANLYDFNFLSPCPSSGLIINGDADMVVSSESVSELYSHFTLK
jgi:alpha/beta superfamily hydrolase